MFEVLRTIAIGRHEDNDPEKAARHLCSTAMYRGALATDILDGVDCVYCNILWPSEKAWELFKHDQRLRKKPKKDIWTKRNLF